jgi:dihydrofolate reductase
MNILTRMCISLDGCLSTSDGLPVQLADPSFVPGQSHGFPEFQRNLEGVLMGRTTFEPALGSDRWPWPDLDVFVLGSRRPEGTPDHVVVESDPGRLLEWMREKNRGGDIHLVGGPTTMETFRGLGALDKLGLLLLPVLVGEGMRLTPPFGPDAKLTLESQHALPEGAVEIVYACA